MSHLSLYRPPGTTQNLAPLRHGSRLERMASRIPPRPVKPEVWLDRLIEAEQVDRQARSLNYQLKVARFPIHRDLMSLIGGKRRFTGSD